jgi:hypothetical protein
MIEQRRTDETDDPPRPSQAEGERDTVEQDLKEQTDKRRWPERATSADNRRNDPPRPSQAEGERDIAEEQEKKP